MITEIRKVVWDKLIYLGRKHSIISPYLESYAKLYSGYIQLVQHLQMTNEKEPKIEPIWTVVANIVPEREFGPGGKEIKFGTKALSPKTKVYIIGWHQGMCESIIVVGLARKPKKFITMTIRVDWVENLRIKLAYNPIVIKKIHEFHGVDQTYLIEEFANEMFKTIPIWQAELKK